jgi:hypothetical protein
MKKKLLYFILGFTAIILVLAIAIPYFYKDQLIKLVNQEASKTIRAKLIVEDLDVSLIQNIKHFPDLTIIAKNVKIIGKDTFSQDTLIQLEKLKISVNIKSVISHDEQIKINTIELYNGTINAIKTSAGNSNWNITSSDTSKKEPAKFTMNLKSIVFENINVLYSDYQTNKHIELYNLRHEGHGDFTENLVDYSSKTSIAHGTIINGAIPYLKNVQLTYDGIIKINQSENTYTFEKNSLQINALQIFLDGTIQNLSNGALQTKLNFKTENTNFKDILSLLPLLYSKNFDEIDAKGSFKLEGTLDGMYHENIYPKMNIALEIQEGSFKYPSLPSNVSHINVDSKITSPGGTMDQLVVNISKFNLMLGANPFMGHLIISSPISDPTIDLMAKGTLNLEDMQKIYPMEQVKTLHGSMHIDLAIKAKKSDFDSKRYQSIKASGSALIQNMLYESQSVEKPIHISNLSLLFSPQYVDMTSCNGKIGKTDFDMKGKLENFIPYYLSKESVMKGQLIFNSNYVDANEFLADSLSVKKAESNKSISSVKEYILVPKNIDFIGSVNIGEMNYGKMNIKNLKGSMSIKNESIRLNDVKANLLGGQAIMNATYSTLGSTIPNGSINYQIQNFDLNQTCNYMESARKLAPIIKYMSGTVSSTSNLTCSLLPDLSPDLNTVNGDLNASIPLSRIVGLPVMDQIANLTKLSQLKNLEVKNVQANLSISKGRIILQPVKFSSNNIKMGLQGSQGLDKSMDYNLSIDVPFSQLGPASGVVDGLLGKVNLPFLNQLKPEIVRMNIKIKGVFEKPQLALGTPQMLKGDGSEASGSSNALDKVKEKGDELKNEAIKRADTLKQQVQKEVEKKVDETKQKLEEEVNKKKDELLDNLKKKLPW